MHRNKRSRSISVNPNSRIHFNDRTMSNTLMSSFDMKMMGISNAETERRKTKKATNSARRRNEKKIIEAELIQAEELFADMQNEKDFAHNIMFEVFCADHFEEDIAAE